MKNKSQKDRIIKKLCCDGEVSRNSALRNYISRLSAIIQSLEEDGWVFETERRGGNYKTEADYVYKVIKSPLKKTVYKVDGREIIKYK
jgi:hypothetical protein